MKMVKGTFTKEGAKMKGHPELEGVELTIELGDYEGGWPRRFIIKVGEYVGMPHINPLTLLIFQL